MGDRTGGQQQISVALTALSCKRKAEPASLSLPGSLRPQDRKGLGLELKSTGVWLVYLLLTWLEPFKYLADHNTFLLSFSHI